MNRQPIPRQRAIIDRRALGERIDALAEGNGEAARGEIVTLLRDALAAGRAELAARLEARPSAGHEITGGHAFLIDQIVRLIHDHVVMASLFTFYE